VKHPEFERFVGIDWCGSKGRYHEGIRIAEFSRRDLHPKLLTAKTGRNWSRSAVVEYIRSLNGRPTLVEIDFAFSLPTPFPVPDLRGPRELWARVDDLCVAVVDEDVREYYAGPIWLSDDSPFRRYMRYAGYRGDLFDGRRLRLTERAATPRATSVYKLMFSQVGRGSFAGMRVLKSLSTQSDTEIAIWPFDDIQSQKVVVVEVYPSAFYPLANCRRPNPKKQARDAVEGTAGRTLKYFGVDHGEDVPRSEDEIDAFVTSAALAHISKDASSFSIPASLRATVAQEGWIFGVPTGGAA
jgi:hypothetical protein